jgi:hypothetical protein
VAQDVERVLPEWVRTDERGYKVISIPGQGLEALTVESVQELKRDNDELRERVRALEAGRRPLISGLGEGGLGLGLVAIAGAFVFPRRRRSKDGAALDGSKNCSTVKP